VEVRGSPETAVEVAEIVPWMTSALQSSGIPDQNATSKTLWRQDADMPTGVFSFEVFQHVYTTYRAPAQCWKGLFRDSVSVAGFPIRRRSYIESEGLEISLGTLAALMETSYITTFDRKVYLKSFCTMLVPTKYMADKVFWHVIFNEDGSRISYSDRRALDVTGDFDIQNHLSLDNFDEARHVIGWWETVRTYAGKIIP
jgi:hypothetical protein